MRAERTRPGALHRGRGHGSLRRHRLLGARLRGRGRRTATSIRARSRDPRGALGAPAARSSRGSASTSPATNSRTPSTDSCGCRNGSTSFDGTRAALARLKNLTSRSDRPIRPRGHHRHARGVSTARRSTRYSAHVVVPARGRGRDGRPQGHHRSGRGLDRRAQERLQGAAARAQAPGDGAVGCSRDALDADVRG